MQNTRVATTLFLIVLTAFTGSTKLHAQWNMIPSGTTQNMFGIHFTTPQKGFAIGWDAKSAVILYTSDGGGTWTPTQRVGDYLFGITSTDSLHIYTVGYAGSCGCGLILGSNDGGTHWSQATDGSTMGYYSAAFGNKMTGYAGGWQGAMAITTNGGVDWSNTPIGDGEDVFKWVGFPSSTIGYAISDSADYTMPHRIWKTVDAGATWHMIQDFGKALVIAAGAFTDPMNGIVVGSDGQGCIYRTVDGGAHWTAVWHGGGANAVLQGATFSPGGIGYAVGTNGMILRSVDHGVSWKLEQALSQEVITAVDAPTDTMAFADGETGVILSRNGSAGVAPEGGRSSNSYAIPNPARAGGEVTIQGMTNNGPAIITVVDLLGQTIRSATISSHDSSVKFIGLQRGTYFYRVADTAGNTETGKIEVM